MRVDSFDEKTNELFDGVIEFIDDRLSKTNFQIFT